MMKKYYFLFMAFAIAFSATSCSKDDDENNGSNTPDGSLEEVDELSFLQESLVQTNEKGEFVKRINGAVLDQNDTTTVYIGRDDRQHAEKTFLEWLSPTTIVNETKNGITAQLKDEKGNFQGTVYFSEALTSDKYNDHIALAVVTFSPETAIKHVKKVVFLPHEAWPLNKHKESPFFVGDTDKRGTYDEGVRDWLCVREAKEGECGLMVYLSQAVDLWDDTVIDHFASKSDAKAAAATIGPQFSTFQNYFRSAGMTLDGDWYWINDYRSFPPGIYSIRLTNGDIDWWNTSFKNPKHRYIQVSTFNQQEYDD